MPQTPRPRTQRQRADSADGGGDEGEGQDEGKIFGLHVCSPLGNVLIYREGHIAKGGAYRRHAMQPMLFSITEGQLICKLTRDRAGNELAPDGETVFDSAQAAAILGIPEEAVRAIWLETWKPLLSADPADESPISFGPEAAAARAICFPALNDEQFEQVLMCCRMWGLNPAKGQVWARRWYDETLKRETVKILPTIMGLRTIAHRTGEHGGSDAPEFVYGDDERIPVKASIAVYRLVDGKRRRHVGTVLWDEYFPGFDLGDFWLKMPCGQLGKCAEAAALRKAFPDEMGGMFIEEELEKSRTPRDGSPQRENIDRPADDGADEYPQTSMGFHMRLIDDYGLTDPARRNALIQSFRAKRPRMLEDDAPAFYRFVLQSLKASPSLAKMG